jgi:hypothetical protein
MAINKKTNYVPYAGDRTVNKTDKVPIFRQFIYRGKGWAE